MARKSHRDRLNFGDPLFLGKCIRGRRQGIATADSSFCRRLRFETLEDRRMLAITVDTLVDEADGSIFDGDVSLRDAIAAASAGDTIDFDPSIYGKTIELNQVLGELSIDKDLTIRSPSSENLRITIAAGHGMDGMPKTGDGIRIFNIDDGSIVTSKAVSLEWLLLKGGDVTGAGGAIRSIESLLLTRVTVSDNFASGDGGGIYLETPIVGGEAIFTSSVITNNTSEGNGGGIAVSASVFPLYPWRYTISYSIVEENSSANHGGGVFADINAQVQLTIAESTISGNDAGNRGGGIYLTNEGVAELNDNSVQSNSATTVGGGVFIRNMGTASVSYSSIDGNSAELEGGGLKVVTDGGPAAATTTVTNTTFFDNRTVNGRGGGVSAFSLSPLSVTTIKECNISNNKTGGNGHGGGLYLYQRSGTTEIQGSTVAGNTSGNSMSTNNRGGGIYLEFAGQHDSGAVTLVNSTISGNLATGDGGGIAVADYGSSSVEIRHTTVTQNSADWSGDPAIPYGNFSGDGGGIALIAGTPVSLSLDHTIVAGNMDNSDPLFPIVFVRPDVFGPVSARYSLIGDDLGATINDRGGNQIGNAAAPIDPLLGPLANNGGPTPTHALETISPAVDSGFSLALPGVTVPSYDQRGDPFGRVYPDSFFPLFSRIDIGAFELQPTPVQTGTWKDAIKYSGLSLEDTDLLDANDDPHTIQALEETHQNLFVFEAETNDLFEDLVGLLEEARGTSLQIFAAVDAPHLASSTPNRWGAVETSCVGWSGAGTACDSAETNWLDAWKDAASEFSELSLVYHNLAGFVINDFSNYVESAEVALGVAADVGRLTRSEVQEIADAAHSHNPAFQFWTHMNFQGVGQIITEGFVLGSSGEATFDEKMSRS